MKEAKASISHCISSNLKLGSGIAPIAGYNSLGLNVVIATDGASSNNNLNLMEEIHLAGMVAKGITKEPTVCSAKELLKMATLNGATAQGRMDCGALKVGNKADISCSPPTRSKSQAPCFRLCACAWPMCSAWSVRAISCCGS